MDPFSICLRSARRVVHAAAVVLPSVPMAVYFTQGPRSGADRQATLLRARSWLHKNRSSLKKRQLSKERSEKAESARPKKNTENKRGNEARGQGSEQDGWLHAPA